MIDEAGYYFRGAAYYSRSGANANPFFRREVTFAVGREDEVGVYEASRTYRFADYGCGIYLISNVFAVRRFRIAFTFFNGA